MSCYNLRQKIQDGVNNLKKDFKGTPVEFETQARLFEKAIRYGYAAYKILKGSVDIKKDTGQRYSQDINDIRIHDTGWALLETKTGRFAVDTKTGIMYNNANKQRVGVIDSMKDMINIINYQADNVDDEIEKIIKPSVMFNAEEDQAQTGKTELLYKISADMINNPDKSLEVFDAIRARDGVHISDEYADHLKAMIRMFVDPTKQLIPNMHQIIEAVESGENVGYFIKDEVARGVYVTVSSQAALYGNQMSATEKYVHEIIHAAVEFAKTSKDPSIASALSELADIYADILPTLKAEDFMPPADRSLDAKKEKEVAQKRLEYLTTHKDSFSEFIAMAVTNENLINKLKEFKGVKETPDKSKIGFYDKAIMAIKTIADKLLNVFRPNSSVSKDKYATALRLIREIAAINNREVANELDNKSPLNVMEKVFVYANTKAKNSLSWLGNKGLDLSEKIAGMDPNEKGADMSLLKKVRVLVFGMPALLAKDEYRSAFRQMTYKVGMGYIGTPEGLIQSIVDRFKETEKLTTAVEALGLTGETISRKRKEFANSMGKMILDAFDGKLNKTEQVVLTKAFVDTDLDSIMGVYSINKIKELYSSKEKLDAEITKLQKVLQTIAPSKEYANYFASQAKGLGRYLSTGRAGKTQMLNANNIVKFNVSSSELKFFKDTNKLITMVDRLATLEAISYLPTETKEKAINLMNKNINGVARTILLTKTIRDEAKPKTNMKMMQHVKGLVREVTADHKFFEIAPSSAKDFMKQGGFKEVGKADIDGMSYYVSTDNLKRSFNAKGIRLTSDRRSMYKYSDAYGKDGKTDFKDKFDGLHKDLTEKVSAGADDVKAQFKSIVEPTLDGLIPVIGTMKHQGRSVVVIKDYEIAIDKDIRESVLESDRRAQIVLGHTYAHTYDAKATEKLNDNILMLMKKDMKDNYIEGSDVGRDGNIYIKIGPKETNEWSKEIWEVLPPKVKYEIIKQHEDSGKTDKPYIAIRRDLVLNYFGNRDPSILDLKWTEHLPKVIKQTIAYAELIWKEIVGIAKIGIVVKTPAVFLLNILSNIITSSIQTGNPFKTIAIQVKGAVEMLKFLRLEKEVNALRITVKTGKATAKEKTQLTALENKMKALSVYPLLESGLYTSISDTMFDMDLEKESFLKRSMNKVVDASGVKQVVPSGVQKGVGFILDHVFATEKTMLFKVGTLAQQVGDFAMKYQKYYDAINKGVPKEVAAKQALDLAININWNDPVVVQYANRMGFMMFTKFAAGMQRVIKNTVKENPINMLLALEFQSNIIRADDMTDQFFAIKDWTNVMYDPLDILKYAGTPYGVKAFEDLAKKITH